MGYFDCPADGAISSFTFSPLRYCIVYIWSVLKVVYVLTWAVYTGKAQLHRLFWIDNIFPVFCIRLNQVSREQGIQQRCACVVADKFYSCTLSIHSASMHSGVPPSHVACDPCWMSTSAQTSFILQRISLTRHMYACVRLFGACAFGGHVHSVVVCPCMLGLQSESCTSCFGKCM